MTELLGVRTVEVCTIWCALFDSDKLTFTYRVAISNCYL